MFAAVLILSRPPFGRQLRDLMMTLDLYPVVLILSLFERFKSPRPFALVKGKNASG
jgi:hypothetical protein